jgi:hypothetical protein
VKPITTSMLPNATFPASTVDPIVTVNITTATLRPTTSLHKNDGVPPFHHAHPCHQKFDYPLPNSNSIHVPSLNPAQSHNNKSSHSHNYYRLHNTDIFCSSVHIR